MAASLPLHILSDDEQLAWLQLTRSNGIGPRSFYKLLALYGSACAVLEVLPELIEKTAFYKRFQLFSKAQAEKERELTYAYGAKLIAACDPFYPPLLRYIHDAPPMITVQGNSQLLTKAAVAVVGARNASLNGKRFARELAESLGKAAVVIVSGLARGIDTAAHEGALMTGTVGVIAGGIDTVYPPENKKLYERMREEGVIVAENAFGMPPRAPHFPQRNRIISGMSKGVIVVEATQKSGSLITARMALEQNREVFAVPGSPLEARSSGPNSLLKEGAILTESAKDVMEALDFSPYGTQKNIPNDCMLEGKMMLYPAPANDQNQDEVTAYILQHAGAEPIELDSLIAMSAFSPSLLLAAVLELELRGEIARYPGNKIVRLYNPCNSKV